MSDDHTTDFTERRLEKSISSIGAKIADANDIAEQIEDLSEAAGDKLCEAQEQLSDLYVSLPDDPNKQAKKPPKVIPPPEIKRGAKAKSAATPGGKAPSKAPPNKEAD